MKAEGTTGWLSLEGDEVHIKKKLMYGANKGVKAITISSISSVQFKEAGNILSGFIQIAFSGGKESHGGRFDAVSDENSVVFTRNQQAAFAAIRDEIRARQAPNAPPSASSADELERFAGLRDRGIITEEEFAAKKRLILDL